MLGMPAMPQQTIPAVMPGMPGMLGMPAMPAMLQEQQPPPAAMPAVPAMPAPEVPAAAEPFPPQFPPQPPAEQAQVQEPAAQPSPPKEVVEWPAWLRCGAPCSMCGDGGTSDAEPHGVVCRRKGKKGVVKGCNMGVCWACMESQPRSTFGIVRTTKEEFDSLEDKAWWMHEKCMEPADLRSYFGGEQELAEARAAADAEDAAEAKASSAKTGESPGKAKKKEADDPVAAEKDRVKKMSVKELKAYLDRHNTSHNDLFEKAELVARAMEVASTAPPEPPPGPAWMPAGEICRVCTKPQAKEQGGIFCRRRRTDGRISGCGQAVCWRCMKRAPKDSFGVVRCTKDEFEGLEDEAWWMHHHCMEDGDWKDYYGESEPEDEKWRRTGE